VHLTVGGGGHLLNDDPGGAVPASMAVEHSVATAGSHVERHINGARTDAVAIALEDPVTMQVGTREMRHVDGAVDYLRIAALVAVDGEVPATAAAMATSQTRAPRVSHEQRRAVVLFGELAGVNDSGVSAVAVIPGALPPVADGRHTVPVGVGRRAHAALGSNRTFAPLGTHALEVRQSEQGQ